MVRPCTARMGTALHWFVAIYTPGRGKIVPHNVTFLVVEKLFYVM